MAPDIGDHEPGIPEVAGLPLELAMERLFARGYRRISVAVTAPPGHPGGTAGLWTVRVRPLGPAEAELIVVFREPA